MDSAPVKTLLVCTNELLRTLLTLKLQKEEKVNLVGSCSYDETLGRFLKIYNPDVVLLYDSNFKKKEIYSCLWYIATHFKTRVLVLSPNMKDYDIKLFFRYGATTVTDGSCDLVRLLVDTKNQWHTTTYPTIHNHFLPTTKENYTNMDYRGEVENIFAYGHKLLYRGANSTTIQERTAFPTFGRLPKTEKINHILTLQDKRELPESPNDLIDYLRLMPETFYPVQLKQPDGKQRFKFYAPRHIVRYVERLRKRKQNEIKTTKLNNYIFDEKSTEIHLKERGYDKK